MLRDMRAGEIHEQPRPVDQMPTNVPSLYARPFRDEENNNQLKKRELQ
jgi:hypothetical protein